jgi:hypothetical protein
LDGFFCHALERIGTRIVAGDRAAPAAHPHSCRDVEILRSAACRDAVSGEARVRFHGALQGGNRILRARRFGVREHRFADFQRFVAGKH